MRRQGKLLDGSQLGRFLYQVQMPLSDKPDSISVGRSSSLSHAGEAVTVSVVLPY